MTVTATFQSPTGLGGETGLTNSLVRGGIVQPQLLYAITQGKIQHVRDVPAVALASKLGSPGFYDFLRRGGVARMASEEHRQIRLRSGEARRVHIDCRATIGEVGHGEHNLRKLGKAGAVRWRGVRPTVRGVAMNPVDHPHGGGEGRTSGGRHPVSPWGVPTKGYKTRGNKRTDRMIVRGRKKK